MKGCSLFNAKYYLCNRNSERSLVIQNNELSRISLISKSLPIQPVFNRRVLCFKHLAQYHIFLPDYLDETFDIVFTSYGVINWFPNLDEWGRIVSRYLKPDGKFVMVEFHPVLWMFDTKFERVESAYSREEPYISTSQTYTNASEAGKEYVEVTWNHGLSKVLQGLLHANLRIVDFQEYDYSPFNLFGNMEEDRGMYHLKDRKGMIPILFSVVAER